MGVCVREREGVRVDKEAGVMGIVPRRTGMLAEFCLSKSPAPPEAPLTKALFIMPKMASSVGRRAPGLRAQVSDCSVLHNSLPIKVALVKRYE